MNEKDFNNNDHLGNNINNSLINKYEEHQVDTSNDSSNSIQLHHKPHTSFTSVKHLNIEPKITEFKNLLDSFNLRIFFLNMDKYKENGRENSFMKYKRQYHLIKDDRFKDDRFKDDRFKDDRFKGDRFKDDRFKGDRFKDDQLIYLSHFHEEIPREFNYNYFFKQLICYVKYTDDALSQFIGFTIIEQDDRFVPIAIAKRPVNGPLSSQFSTDKTKSLKDDRNSGKCKKFSADQKFSIIIEIVYGIAFIHSKNFIHSNLNPTTVYLNENNFPVICDNIFVPPFKVKTIQNENEEEEEDDENKYKFSYEIDESSEFYKKNNSIYIAPEILQGIEISQKSDIFSLGLTIFYILAEKEATFSDDNNIEFPTDFPKNWKEMIERCVSNDPAKRPTANSILNELSDDKNAIQFISSIENNSEAIQISAQTNLILSIVKSKIKDNLNGNFEKLNMFQHMIPNIDDIDYETNLLISAAEIGDVKSIEKVGDSFFTGERNLYKDDYNAYKCYEFAANKGSLYSICKVAKFNEVGIGTEQNLSKALFYYKKALEMISVEDPKRQEIQLKIDEIEMNCITIVLINIPLSLTENKIISIFKKIKLKSINIENKDESQNVTIQFFSIEDQRRAMKMIREDKNLSGYIQKPINKSSFDSIQEYIPKIDINDFYPGKGNESFKLIYCDRFFDYFLVYKKSNDMPFTVKIVRFSLDETLINLIKKNLNLSSKFNHPAILRYIGFSEFNLIEKYKSKNQKLRYIEKPTILMECYNEKLTNGIECKKFNNTIKLKIIIGIASGLSEIYKKGIIHKYLCSEDILLNGNFEPVICNLGYQFEESSKDKPSQFAILLRNSMAPELYDSDKDFIYNHHEVSYSFGIILYQILFDKLYFYPEDDAVSIMKYKFRNYVPKIPDDLNEVFKYIIKSCWNIYIDERLNPSEIYSILIESFNSSNDLLPDVDKAEVNNYIQKLQANIINEKDVYANIRYLLNLLKQNDQNALYQLGLIFYEASYLLKNMQSISKIKTIALGSYGEIYLCENKFKKEKFIEKIFYHHFKDNSEEKKIKIMTDLSVIYQLNHPCICKCLGFCPYGFKDEKRPIIFLEYIKNCSLFDIVNKNSKFSGWNNTKKLINIYGIALGMSYLHSHDILHFNLNPKSILEDEQFYPKINNICISNNFDNMQSSSKIIETTPFNAPEIFIGNEYNKASEVYSFGMIIYSIFTNKYPYQGCSHCQVLNQIVEGNLPQFEESIPKAYWQLIVSCLSLDPEDRPTFDSIVDQLQNNHEFLIESIDQIEYQNYIKYTKSFHINNNLEPCPSLVINEWLKSKSRYDMKEENESELKQPDKIEIEEEEEKNENENDISFPFLKNIPTLSLKNLTQVKYIGHGGFSDVYLVKDKITNTEYAAKVIIYEQIERFQDFPIGIEFIREILCHSEAKHETIAKFIGYNRYYLHHERRPVIFTEYFGQNNLRTILQEERKEKSIEKWNDTQRLIVIYGIAYAMYYLHSIGILHRDLNPSNVLVNESFYPKIIDFGLSKKISENELNDELKEILSKRYSFGKKSDAFGTSGFIAPEVYSKQEYSKQSDVYAFAIIVYEILSKKDPYESKSGPSIMYEITMKKDRPKFDKEFDKNYRSLIKSCWSEDPSKRPSFETIVNNLRKDPKYITKSVDKNAFYHYIESLDKKTL